MKSSKAIWNLICLAIILRSSAGHAADVVKRLEPAPEGSFSIVVIPDTQVYRPMRGAETTLHNPIFSAHIDWILDNLESQNIEFVSHVGDIVDKNIDSQWEAAKQCMSRLDGHVPYGISVGNHDMTSRGDSSLFQKYFPASHFTHFPWYGGTLDRSEDGSPVSVNNANSYQLLTLGGRRFLFLHLECNAPDPVLEWANGILKAHPDRLALVTTHMGLGPLERPRDNAGYISDPKGRMRWVKIHGARGNSPQQMWEKCFSLHPNLVAVFCGDQSRTQAMHTSTPGIHGNVIHEILSDYSVGWLRVVRFLPESGEMRIITVHPRTNELCLGTERVPDPAEHQFSLPVQLEISSPAATSH